MRVILKKRQIESNKRAFAVAARGFWAFDARSPADKLLGTRLDQDGYDMIHLLSGPPVKGSEI